VGLFLFPGHHKGNSWVLIIIIFLLSFANLLRSDHSEFAISRVKSVLNVLEFIERTVKLTAETVDNFTGMSSVQNTIQN